MRHTDGRPHLFPGLDKGHGVQEVVPLDAAPAGPVVGDGLTGADVFVIEHIATVVQDAATGQLAAPPPGPRADHLAVQGHQQRRARAERRRAAATHRGAGLGREAAVRLPALTQSRGRPRALGYFVVNG